MARLLPEIDGLLELHLALVEQVITHANVLDESVALKLSAEDGANETDGDVHLVHLHEVRGPANELAVQRENAGFELGGILERTSCVGKSRGSGRHDQ